MKEVRNVNSEGCYIFASHLCLLPFAFSPLPTAYCLLPFSPFTSMTLAENQSLWNKIQRFEFDDPKATITFSKKLADQQRWSASYTQRVIEEYRRTCPGMPGSTERFTHHLYRSTCFTVLNILVIQVFLLV